MSDGADLTKFRALARNWEALGDDDPLFGVLSDPTKYGGKWDPQEFFASGRAHVDKLLRMLSDARASFEPGSCLDFGCGPGRLTVPLSEHFARTVGVDVARPMIETATRLTSGARCEFVVNRDPHLRRFADRTFDVVHSCLVLQHIPPDVSVGYIAEFFRVCKTGGLVVFQVPAAVRPEAEISAAHALPASACVAGIVMSALPTALECGSRVEVGIQLTNRGDRAWPHDIPAGRHLCVGNHWTRDDGRTLLPRTVHSGESIDVGLIVQAPDTPGRYWLEVDMVQEYVCWFADKGAPIARALVTVAGASAAAAPAVQVDRQTDAALATARPPRAPFMRRVLRRLKGATPTFEMHVVPRDIVEATIHTHGGVLLRAVDDNAAGPGWLSYTYICRKIDR